jgi:hypothetical protein
MRTALYAFTALFLFSASTRAATMEERVAALEKEVATLKRLLTLNLKPQLQPAAATTPAGVPESVAAKGTGLLSIVVSNKQFQPVDIHSHILESTISWDQTVTLSKGSKPTRAIKGALVISDLFDEVKVRVAWTVNHPLKPGESYSETNIQVEYNQFSNRDQWLRSTELKDMKIRFEVESVIYAE